MFNIKKRGQFSSRVFVFMIILIAIAIILLFGYTALSKVLKKGDQAVMIKFQSELKSDVESMSFDKGSVKVEKYRPPSNFDEICFVDLEEVDPTNINNSVIRDSVESGARKNLFFIGKDDFESDYIEDLRLFYFPFFSCIKPRPVELRIEGRGDGAAVRAVPPDKELCLSANDHSDREAMCNALEVFGLGYRKDCCDEYGLCCEV